MTNESLPNRDLQSVWQNQPAEGIRMSVDEIRRRAGKFERKIYWRNAREYVAALVVVIFFGYEFWRTPDALSRVGFGLAIAGLLYLVWHLYRKGSSRGLPGEMGLASGVEFFRRELERQRDLVQHVWRWYLGPLVPGMIVLIVAFSRTNPGHMRHYGWFLGAYSALAALTFVFIAKLNERGARRLQRRIDELNALITER
ncbi:MAG TPA: hypothetical protein VL523_08200 [Terriglobia bacterium]|nr:hypothetical protein [Terriglobia bacterium]